MARSRSRRDNNLRRQIAHQAARLIAVDGVADFATAKMKAARQAGLADSKILPDNDEIEEALREYQALYQSERQPAHLRRLREAAVKVMRELEQFRPVLVGSVLAGTAGEHSDVNLQLFTDDPKALTLFLLNRRVRFDEGTRRMRRGDQSFQVPQIRMQFAGAPVTLTVLDFDDERSSARARDDEALQRARIAEVEALLAN